MSSKQTLFFTNQLFERTSFPHKAYIKSTFENCVFKDCDFSGLILSGNDFIDTSFEYCNLSLAKMDDTGLKNINFKNCKLTGVDFAKCKDFLFGVNFSNCILDYTGYFKKKNKQGKFIDCSLKDADFTNADLTGALFQNCDLANAVFSRTVLDGSDLTTSYNFNIDPEQNSLKKARFSYNGLPGLLSTYNIIIE